MSKKEWFADWFDSEYYHILYKERNDEDAQFFIKNLLQHLKPNSTDLFLDLACGKGRHSLFLHQQGMKVEGCDLSANSIAFANKTSQGNVHFYEHDMRDSLPKNYEYILNLFTSFGYFDDLNDNLKVLKSIKSSLEPEGKVVIDFFNAHYVITNLVQYEEKTVDGINFEIRKSHSNGHIYKDIKIFDGNESLEFQEKVQAITLEDFTRLAKETGLKIDSNFGNHDLEPYNMNLSERLILILSHE